MIRRKVLVVCIAVLLVIFSGLLLTSCKQETDNVFDQLYDEVETVRRGRDSVLLSGTESAYADYDFGMFENIQIPDLDMCLSIDSQSLYMLFFSTPEAGNESSSRYVLYRYDLVDHKLYGENTVQYLSDNFLFHYFQWCSDTDEANAYSLSNLGEFTFIQEENVYYN